MYSTVLFLDRNVLYTVQIQLICISSVISCSLIIRVDGYKALIRKLDLGLSWVHNTHLPVIKGWLHGEWNVDNVSPFGGRWQQADLEFSEVLIRQPHNVRDRGLWARCSRGTGRLGKVATTRGARRLGLGWLVRWYRSWMARNWFACSLWHLLFGLLPAHLDRIVIFVRFSNNMWIVQQTIQHWTLHQNIPSSI